MSALTPMSISSTLIFWSIVAGIQATGFALDAVGGNLDDPIRLLGLLLLEPGVSFLWDWVPKHVHTHAQYEGAILIAAAINLAIAGAIYVVCTIVRKLRNAGS